MSKKLQTVYVPLHESRFIDYLVDDKIVSEVQAYLYTEEEHQAAQKALEEPVVSKMESAEPLPSKSAEEEECNCSCWDCDICGAKMEAACIATKKMEEYASKSEWISVEDRLPETKEKLTSKYVLTVNKYGHYDCLEYVPHLKKWFKDSSILDKSDIVTHWMPLPKSPNKPTN